MPPIIAIDTNTWLKFLTNSSLDIQNYTYTDTYTCLKILIDTDTDMVCFYQYR